MKFIHYVLGVLLTFALMIVLLLTSVEAVAYWTPGYYEKEYTKYNVTAAVQMEMSDLLDVTDEMMAYLRGDREDLHVPTIVNGEAREFFNEREIAHMEDVRGLFIGGLRLRLICIGVIVLCLAALILLKSDLRRVLPRSVCAGTGLFFAVICILAAVISRNFTKYFIIFHHIFFNNDLWILDPRTDLLINIVPEPFFMDTAARIALIFGISVAAVFLICLILVLKDRKRKRRGAALALSLALLLSLFPADTARAAGEWPENINIEAEGGIVMDAATGSILYGKNIHNTYYPASITKILTALIVLENCGLDEMVTFSYNAVHNVEADSTSAGLDTGDVLSVNDCLYALLLKSANEVANALAEHVAGSNEAFAEMMNEKAASLGCVDSHFANPSGLNNENHYTSAYDMALIGQAALQNKTFMKIDSTLYYDLPVTKRNPEGARIYPGHKMLKKNLAEYYSGCLGGKTGYTSLAGNTLVTFAERDGMTLVAVVLNGHQSHYRDTKTLLDFGFKNFQTVKAADFDANYTPVENDMLIAGLPAAELAGLQLDPDGALTLPRSGDLASVASYLTYNLPDSAPADAIARVDYYWGEHSLGHAYLTMSTVGDDSIPIPATMLAEINDITKQASEADESAEAVQSEKAPFYIPPIVWIIFGSCAALVVLAFIVLAIRAYFEKKENDARMRRRQKRMSRMGDGVSTVDIDLEMERRRNYYTAKRSPRRRNRPR